MTWTGSGRKTAALCAAVVLLGTLAFPRTPHRRRHPGPGCSQSRLSPQIPSPDEIAAAKSSESATAAQVTAIDRLLADASAAQDASLAASLQANNAYGEALVELQLRRDAAAVAAARASAAGRGAGEDAQADRPARRRSLPQRRAESRAEQLCHRHRQRPAAGRHPGGRDRRPHPGLPIGRDRSRCRRVADGCRRRRQPGRRRGRADGGGPQARRRTCQRRPAAGRVRGQGAADRAGGPARDTSGTPPLRWNRRAWMPWTGSASRTGWRQ